MLYIQIYIKEYHRLGLCYAGRGKFECYTFKYALRNIAGKASDIHEEVSLEVKLPNTDWCSIAGKASDMHAEVSLNVTHSNTY